MKSTFEKLKRKTVELVTLSCKKLTPHELEKKLAQEFNAEKKEIKTAFKELVAAGELSYTYLFGNTYLELSFIKPVRVAERVILKPPEFSFRPEKQELVVNLMAGASFGTGQHPTTRLCIRGLEFLWQNADVFCRKKTTKALDVGTGSGVLAITALLMGINRAVGTDIDECARSEARENIKLNGLEHKIAVEDKKLEAFAETFDLVCANLRSPTIKNIYTQVERLTVSNCFVVFSGMKEEEAENVVDLYTTEKFSLVWKRSEKGWTGLVFTGTDNKLRI